MLLALFAPPQPWTLDDGLADLTQTCPLGDAVVDVRPNVEGLKLGGQVQAASRGRGRGRLAARARTHPRRPEYGGP